MVAAGQARPVNTKAPVISGAAQLGVRLTTSNGTWTGTPPISSYSYDWWRCDPTGNNCKVISGQTGSSYTLVAADLGQTIRSRVTATNSVGSTSAESNQTGLVTGTVTPVTGTVRADAVTLPDRLVISNVSFAPRRLTNRAGFTASFRVTDSNGQPVSGALVYAIALPYGWIRTAARGSDRLRRLGADSDAADLPAPTQALRRRHVRARTKAGRQPPRRRLDTPPRPGPYRLTMLTTPFTELLDCRVPLQLAAMGGGIIDPRARDGCLQSSFAGVVYLQPQLERPLGNPRQGRPQRELVREVQGEAPARRLLCAGLPHEDAGRRTARARSAASPDDPADRNRETPGPAQPAPGPNRHRDRRSEPTLENT